ncbi:GNAT family N-acetyltransferase [Massilibacteroides sp.]|uniref:GNAT family N-acetyltransferase n=1 Tax=Massilibacteroides sp. TaxID=2034766 RepID=UPI00260A7DAC|nr:GNAT family N-acetyltransferase [Massilibacteroides sp.]MDD4516453.1 GNAT family N-acetyltransferase [Massilibacteroides sp.]
MKRQGTEELWRVCFGDTEEFIRLFFDNVYQNDSTLVIEKQGRIVAALQLLPYTMLLEDKEVPISYICGVSTLPAERGKGMMRQLMGMADNELKRRNIPLATLIPAEPWLFDIYRKYGYQEAFFYQRSSYTASALSTESNLHISVATETDARLFPFLDQKLRERKACVLHSETDFEIIRQDLDISGGKLLIATNENNEIVGMAFTLPEEEGHSVFIPEFVYNNDSIKEELLNATAKQYNQATVNYLTPPNTGKAFPKGMAKIIDADYFKKRDIDIQALFSDKNAGMTLMLD